MVCPPCAAVTVTAPFGLAQLMFRTARSTGVPGEPVIVAVAGRRRDVTVTPVHPSAPRALSRLPVIVPASAPRSSPPARSKFRIARQSRVGSCALSRAATPVTWGVAIEVPLRYV